jgi:hypothetical protein
VVKMKVARSKVSHLRCMAEIENLPLNVSHRKQVGAQIDEFWTGYCNKHCSHNRYNRARIYKVGKWNKKQGKEVRKW